jgi:hypothetical protein
MIPTKAARKQLIETLTPSFVTGTQEPGPGLSACRGTESGWGLNEAAEGWSCPQMAVIG